MPAVDVVTYSLPNQVIADRPDLEPVFRQDVMTRLAVAVIGKCFLHVEMIAPTGQFQSIKTHFTRHFREFLKREVSPLSGK